MTGTTERVLVATDLTEACREAVHFAAALAKTLPATLELPADADAARVSALNAQLQRALSRG